MTKRPLGIYVHIPFCVKKCNYCDFLSAPGDINCVREYVFMLVKEIKAFKPVADCCKVQTVYFGGGTPSSIDEALIRNVFDAIKDTFDISELTEATIEVNPGTAEEGKLKAYRNMGFNRISIGIQSADNDELKLLGRIHSFEEAEKTVALAREAGFMNLSVDVMSALPGQTFEKYESNLKKILQLKPEHISSYSLILEEGTPFYAEYGPEGKSRAMIPDEETDRKMYARTNEMLKEYGYERYEISNYAKPGYESKHNSSYWIGTDYIGFGLGASSLINNKRYRNVSDHTEYGEGAGETVSTMEDISTGARLLEENLSREDCMKEFMILGLRMTKGVSAKEFQTRFGTDIYEKFGKEIHKLIREGILEEKDNRIALTEFGLDVSNYAFELFI